ncbi:hypothetical protein HUJ04_010117 [Dendroctonus ponderosae]|nr:hypothetical protein HUJ04_010117 [Dendroctonus ponderosae]KAH1027563.1 hypothetical protein HUJ05_001045 [Dendroctonus ponderosae]
MYIDINYCHAFGLDEDVIQKAIQMNGAFVIKASEMQETLDGSVANFRAFFKWLYSCVLVLMGEPIPPNFEKTTQRSVMNISTFIKNFDCYGYEENPTVKNKFMMERIGQYLIDRDLTIKHESEGNDWAKLLEENECLRNHPTTMPHYPEKSIVQLLAMLKDSVFKVFKAPMRAINDAMATVYLYNCFNFGSPDIPMSSISITKDVMYFAFIQSSKRVQLLQVHFNETTAFEGRLGSFRFNQQSLAESLKILDLQFYSKDILSLLLNECDEPRRSCIFQLSIPLAIEHFRPFELDTEFQQYYSESVNAWDFVPRHCKMSDLPASRFAVSGTRRLCVLLSEDQRNIQLFELECDDEDVQEDADMSVVHSDDLDLP